jgi:hypothetical protein
VAGTATWERRREPFFEKKLAHVIFWMNMECSYGTALPGAVTGTQISHSGVLDRMAPTRGDPVQFSVDFSERPDCPVAYGCGAWAGSLIILLFAPVAYI